MTTLTMKDETRLAMIQRVYRSELTVAVAEQVIAEIDRDREGAISQNEASSYAELLKRDLTPRMDGRKVELKLTASEFVPPAELRTGSEIIQLEFSAAFGPLAAAPRRLALENRHLPEMSVYLINAAQPGFAAVQITRQKRDDNQSAGESDFTFHPLGQLLGFERCGSC